MSKKIVLLFLIIFLAGLFLPYVTLAGVYRTDDDRDVCYEGLVPCGLGKPLWEGPEGFFDNKECSEGTPVKTTIGVSGKKYDGIACQFCHFFVMFDGIVDFVLKFVVPPIAVLMLVIGGIMFYFAGGDPSLVTRGRSLIKNVVIGLFLAYGAFMLIGMVLTIIGAAEVSPIKDIFQNGVFTIDCEITL